MVEQARAEFDVDAIGGVREQIGPQDAQNGLENRDRQQTDDQHVEGAQRPVYQHLVDDDLEEQRRDQGEQLQEERRDQHLAQKMPIFVDRSQKPGDVEPAAMSDNPARRVIRISPPSQTARSSARVIKAGGTGGDCTKTLSSAALATTMNPPSRRLAMAGKGVPASRDQSVR